MIFGEGLVFYGKENGANRLQLHIFQLNLCSKGHIFFKNDSLFSITALELLRVCFGVSPEL